MAVKFDQEQFCKFRDFIHYNFGIFYADLKQELLRIKIDKCLLKSGINSYDDYFKLISENLDGVYLRHFIDEITVNKTEFFREAEQFNFIRDNKEFILKQNPSISLKKEIRVWSMACSTGQEPYTLAMVLKCAFPEYKINILATDVSCRVLKNASEGVYPIALRAEIEEGYLKKHFEIKEGQLIAKKELKSLIKFRQFNLVNPFPFANKFDIIFCRNVMIYFDKNTQNQILEKIDICLSHGGLLFLGLSESLLNKDHSYKSLKSSIYKKSN